MKIILSRKGFDSGSGRVPSPIFADGRMMSLPIPDRESGIAYQDIHGDWSMSMSEAVSQLAGIPKTHQAHLDPDLRRDCLARMPGWRPIFGQVGAAEGHLRKQRVGTGDVFLFFGLFRNVEKIASSWRYVQGSKPIHSLFGWLQVAQRIPVSSWVHSQAWALYHPHFKHRPSDNNVIYVSTRTLSFRSGHSTSIPGAGLFPFVESRLKLTAPNSRRPGLWLLPEWFYPKIGTPALTYHADISRWQKVNGAALLASVARGQEFVLDCDYYPEAMGWLADLFNERHY